MERKSNFNLSVKILVCNLPKAQCQAFKLTLKYRNIYLEEFKNLEYLIYKITY